MWYNVSSGLRACIVLTVVCSLWTIVSGQNMESTALNTAIARSDAIVSGQIMYSMVSGAGNGTNFKREPFEYELTFSGPSWKKRHVYDAEKSRVGYSESLKKAKIDPKSLPPRSGQGEKVTVSHKGRQIEYQSSPQHGGDLRKVSSVKTGEVALLDNYPPPPHFASTFWFAAAQKFVTDNKANAKQTGTATIDGHNVVIYEWTISASKAGSAFRSVNELTQDGGILRVYIAPGLGHMIPKIEHVGVSGKVGAVFEGSDFIKCNGMYFPQMASIQYIKSDGPSYRTEFRIKHIERINEPIPESEFVLELPVGTQVRDSRDGKKSTFFEVTKDSPIPEGLSAVVLREGDRNTPWFRSWKGAVAIGVGLGVIGLLVLFVSKRVQARRVAS